MTFLLRRHLVTYHRYYATAAVLLSFVYGLWLIFSLQRTFVWDPSIWYGLYHYFAERLYYGVIPLWNPYMNGGEPFWPVFGLFRLIDPINLLFIGIGRITGLDVFHLYHIQFVIKYLISCGGVLALLYHLNKNYIASLTVAAIYATYCVTVNLWDGAYMVLSWFPFILLFSIRYLENLRTRDLLLACYFLGVYIGAASYQFIAGLFVIFCFLVVHLFLHPRFWFQRLPAHIRQQPLFVFACVLLVVAMSLPALVTAAEFSAELIPIARSGNSRALFDLAESVFSANYTQVMGTHEFTTVQAILDHFIAFPFGPYNHNTSYKNFSYLFIGLAGIGLLCNRNTWRMHFALTAVIILFVVFGTLTPVHRYLTIIFPPLKLIRQTHVFFFVFFFLIECHFAAMGLVTIKRWLKTHTGTIGDYAGLALPYGMLIFVIAECTLTRYISVASTQSVNSYFPDFDHKAKPVAFIDHREFAMGRSRYYLYEPILYRRNVALQMLAPTIAGKSPEEMPLWQAWNRAAAKDPNPHGSLVGAGMNYRTLTWTKRYYNLYRLGEMDADMFAALMSVDEPMVRFVPNAIPLTATEFTTFVRNCSAPQLRRFLAHTAIVMTALPPGSSGMPSCAKDIAEPSESGATISVREFSANSLVIAVDARRDGYLTYADIFSKDWSVSVDNHSAPLLEVNGGFKGVHLTAGQHIVEFHYRPLLFVGSMWLYFALCVTAPMLLVASRRQDRARMPTNAER